MLVKIFLGIEMTSLNISKNIKIKSHAGFFWYNIIDSLFNILLIVLQKTIL